MIAGADWAWGDPSEESLDAAGVRFCARYLCSDQYASKRIDAAEAARHLAAGRDIVLVWEDGANRMLAGQSGGQADARRADELCNACGLHGAPVYFAADWDASPQQQPLIDAYLRGAASVIGKPRVGLYSGYWVASRVRAAGLVTYIWGTPAWSGGNWKTCGWKPAIMQGVQTTIGGVSCDWNTAYVPDYGQYKRAEDWQEAMMRRLPVLKAGATGGDVRTLQGLLTARGKTVTVDGVLGAQTTAALRAFQTARHITVDGIAGQDSWVQLHLP